MVHDGRMSARTPFRVLVAFLGVAVACSGDDSGATGSATAASATTMTSGATAMGTTVTASAATTESTGGSATGSASESSGGTDGTSGTGATSGTSGTTGGGGGGGFCQEACAGDGDCMVDGVDAGYVCKDARCLPTGKPAECNSDLFCQIVLGSALNFCDAPDACMGGRVCVALAGFSQGACLLPSDGMGGCASPFGPATLPLLGGGEAEVCYAPTGFCDKANSVPALLYCNVKPTCADDSECAAVPGQPVCGGGGECVCTMDAHCAGFVNQPHCVGGRCECTSDQECAGSIGIDTCVDGTCGCGSASVCPTETYFDGTDVVCEPI